MNISVEKDGPIWSHSMKEDDGPPVEYHTVDLIVYVDDREYCLEYSEWDDDDALFLWVNDYFPRESDLEWEFDKQKEMVKEIRRQAKAIIAA